MRHANFDKCSLSFSKPVHEIYFELKKHFHNLKALCISIDIVHTDSCMSKVISQCAQIPFVLVTYQPLVTQLSSSKYPSHHKFRIFLQGLAF